MKFRIITTLLFALAVCCPVSAADHVSISQITREGRKLKKEAVEKLEAELKKDPNDIETRTKLLGYYFSKGFRDQSAKKTKGEHVAWLIKNAPEAEVLGTHYGTLNNVFDRPFYVDGKLAWNEQLKKSPENLKVLENAANYFFLSERETSLPLLEKLHTLDPNNPAWASKLGQFYSLGQYGMSQQAKQESAVKALSYYEVAYKKSTTIEQDSILISMAKMAFAAGKMKDAKQYAEQILANNAKGWNYGNHIHHGNIILGRLALKNDDKDGAKKHLLLAGKTPGSPQLNSFGPNMTLAKDLLEKEEREVVLKYFDLCEKFWKMGKKQLDAWRTTVKQGNVPDFGGNLLY